MTSKAIGNMISEFKTIRSFEREIFNSDSSLDNALEQEITLKHDIYIFKESTKPNELVKKKQKTPLNLKQAIILLNGRQKFLTLLKKEYFWKNKMTQEEGFPSILVKISDRKKLKILNPKQMLQRLPIALSQIKVAKTSEN